MTFTKVHMHFVVTGHGITKAVARAVQLSAEKHGYAPITRRGPW